jgi:predicted NBD/HSP70 family sugar kinase
MSDGLFDFGLKSIHQLRQDFPWHTTRAEQTVDQIITMIHEELISYAASDKKIWGIGISAPGPVDARTHEIVFGSFLLSRVNDTGIRKLEEAFSCPVIVGNDANVMALAEKTKGEARNLRNFAFMTIGYGVGAGIIAGGRLLLGSQGYSGEIGHVFYENNGRLCACGNEGCVGTVVGSKVILEEATKMAVTAEESHLSSCLKSQGKITMRDIGLAAGSGDARCISLIKKVGDALGVAVASIVNVINPEMIFVGGPTIDLGELLLSSMRQSLIRHSFPQAASQLVVKRTILGDSVGMLGAACLVAEEVLSAEKVARLIGQHKKKARS